MATQKDVQDLLRMLTSGRNKLPMMAAMARMKNLQAVGIRSIGDVSAVDLAVLTQALGDEKAAKQLHSAAKKEGDPSKKRKLSDDASSPNMKRKRSAYEIADEPQTPRELEESLALPEPGTDEEEIRQTVLYCNRAPLVLAFAVVLLRYTMPEQPLSSRLSLAQAVVSLNSRSKAVSLGIAEGTSAGEEGWGQGQPKVRVMGREVNVLKRGGYELEEPANVKIEISDEKSGPSHDDGSGGGQISSSKNTQDWTVSQKVSSKGSTFIARSIGGIKSSSHAKQLHSQLLSSNPELRSATHNITAWRTQASSGKPSEESNDDGETGAGAHILNILRSSNITNVMIVLTRWYGGTLLGPQRWTLMSQVCQEAISERLRVPGTVNGEALWGLDLEVMKAKNAPVTGYGLPIHRPESARAYILKAFLCPPIDAVDSSDVLRDSTPVKKKRSKMKTGRTVVEEKERNLGLLLGALELLFSSWLPHISREELDRRAWGWYCRVRPEVEDGVAGWGGKGLVRLGAVLGLRWGGEG